jgi:hypothetical protein
MERFNIKKLYKVEGKVQYQVKTSNAFAAFENLDEGVDISKALETIKDNTSISSGESLCYYELKKHKPWFDEGYSELLDQRKEAKLQWLQYPSQVI